MRTTAHRGLIGATIAIAVVVGAPVASAASEFGPSGGVQYTFPSSTGAPFLIASGDFNGDGVPDVAVGTDYPGTDGEAGQVSVLLGNVETVDTPHGLPKEEFTGFTPAPGSPIYTSTAPSAVVTGDFNGDSHEDIAVLSSMGGGLIIYLGNGHGDFTVAPGPAIGVTGLLAVGKFTTGKPDEIAAVDGDTVSVIGENGSGQFATLKTSTVNIPDSQDEAGVAAGTFTSNANVDLAVLDGATANVEELLGGGGGGFALSSASPIKSGLNAPGCTPSTCLYTGTSITTGNFNGDAHPDLAIGTFDGHLATVLGAGGATGTFTAAPGSPYVADPNGDDIAQLIAAPFGTGSEDGIATANYFQGGCEEPCSIPADSVSVMLPAGNGALTEAPGSPYLDGGVTTGLAAGDFNQDGLTDLSFLDSNDCQGNAIGVLLNFGVTGTALPSDFYPADRCPIPTPTVTTGQASAVTLTSATLNGTVDPNFQKVTCEFQYGLGSSREPFTNSVPCVYPNKPGDLSVSAQVKGLRSLSPYHFRLVASSGGGTIDGGTQTFQTCVYPQVSFGNVVANGCFSKDSNGQYASTGDANVNGILFEPAHGGITLDPNDKSLSARGNGLMKVAGFLPVPWLGSLKMDLNGTFDVTPNVNFTLAGFRIEGKLTGSVLPGGEFQLMAQTSMNIIGSPVQASVGIVTANENGNASLAGAAIGIGPADADPLAPDTLMYCNPDLHDTPEGFDCKGYPAGSKNPIYRLTPKGQNPENQTKIDPNNMPYCSMTTPPPIGYKCVTVQDKNSRLGESPRLIALNPGVVKLAGFLPLEGFGLSYDSNGGTWMGSATIDLNGLLPGQGRFTSTDNTTLEVDLTIGTNPFQFDSGGFALNGAVALTPEGDDGPELTDASFHIMLHPSFDIGGSLGVVIKSGASISGDFGLSFGSNSGFDLSVHGNITTAAGIGWGGNARFDDEDGGLSAELGGSITRSFGPVSVTVGIDGAMEFEPAFHFQLQANGNATLGPLTASVNGIVSDAGVGLCGSAHVLFGTVDVGFTWTHQDGFNWDGGCDFGSLETVQFASSPDRAHAALAARTITVAPRTAQEEFAAVGTGGPPGVTLTGPGGTTLSTPATANRLAVSRAGLAIAVTDSDTTFFVVQHPAAGKWQLSPAGGPAPVRYEIAKPLVPIDLKATLTGNGKHRFLRWSMHPQTGLTVQFLQLGGAGEPITTTRSGRGRARFTVAPGPGGRREIVAIVSISGIPRRKLTVAKFKAAAPTGPAVSHADYTLSRGSLKISWRRAVRVAHYEVDVTLRKGLLSFLYRPSTARAKLILPPGAKIRRVSITATGESGLIGKSVAARLEHTAHHKRHRR